jgi:hypothetical protein
MHSASDTREHRGREYAIGEVDLGSAAFARHFTASELGGLWKLDETTIRRMFQDEPGVLKIGKSNRRDGKRDYVTLRIPETGALRVYAARTR